MASRLPKPSGVPRPMAMPLPRIRRSKSHSDIRSVNLDLPYKRPVLATIPQNSAPSVTRNPVKRPAPPAAVKKTNEPKPKVARQTKVPDWDYKTRFQMLNEKHTQLKSSCEEMKGKLADLEGIDSKFRSLEEELEKLKAEHRVALSKIASHAKEVERLRLVENKHKELQLQHQETTTAYERLKTDSDKCMSEKENLQGKLSNALAEIESLKKKVDIQQDELFKSETLRRVLHNTVQDLKGNIRVFCRVRPPIMNEEDRLPCNINVSDETCIEIRKSKESINAISGRAVDNKCEFTFDRVFGHSSTQVEIFQELSQLVQSALDGYNVCVFAYGQTGSGKTYTMQGLDNPEHRGMIPRTVHLIFDQIGTLHRNNWEYVVKVSFLEIYNEMVRDLLVPEINQNLEIQYNGGKGTTVANLNIVEVTTAQELMELISRAHENRKVAATNFNEYSSRSHAITKIYLEGANKAASVACLGSISLVDLAGSENAKCSPGGERLAETKHINKSLSTLGNVMMGLWKKEKHIPYRNSKLTYLLQSSLGGNSKTLMVVNISPFEENYFESVNSMRFASKVKEVKTMVSKNRINTNQTPI